MNQEIKNLDVYTENMRKSLIDKIFFIDKVDARVFIDYGCGDGSLIGFLAELFPNYVFIGYDNNPDMIKLCKESNYKFNCKFVSDIETLQSEMSSYNDKKCLILSSILHEIYSYLDEVEIKLFFNFVFSGAFDFIVTRDMMMSKFASDEQAYSDIIAVDYGVIGSKIPTTREHLKQFEDIWGSISKTKNFYHFLLKYRFLENWNREVKENYLPITVEEFLSLIPDNYRIDYSEHFILPFLKRKVEEDFGIVLKENTHFKLILRKI